MALEVLKSKFEDEVEKMRQLEKDRIKCITNRKQLESQLTENKMVKEVGLFGLIKELDRLESSTNVFKLIGPVLVKQNLSEAQENVNKRIEYIETEIKRVESVLVDFSTKMDTQKNVMEKTRDQLKAGMASLNALVGTAKTPS